MRTMGITEAVMADELAAITAWAARHGWHVTYDPQTLKGVARTIPPGMPGDVPVTFWFDVEGYPDRQPPAWWCGESGTNPRDFPRPRQTPGTRPGIPVGSIFHSNPVICAPWNRLAYSVHGGPHSDWTLSAWKTNGAGYTQAHTIADMLSALRLHLSLSDGMQGQ